MSVRPSGLRGALSLPAVGLTLMPKVVCPACWPAYAGLLSAVGVGFIPTAAYLVPLTVVFLVVAVVPLAVRARSGKSRVPFVLGLVASGLILLGQSWLRSDPTTYVGVAVLVAAWLCESRSHREVAADTPCPACAPGQGVNPQSAKGVVS